MANVEIFDTRLAAQSKVQRRHFLHVPFDQLDKVVVAELVGASDPSVGFRYIVTPNADHVVRLNRQPDLRPFYDNAWMTLCDSKPIHMFAKARAQNITHVTGSDLTVRLFESVIRKGDRIVIVVGTQKVADDMRAAYPDLDIRAHVPPMGLWKNPEAMQECVEFIERESGRFTFIAVGSPQSEKIAYMLARRGLAVGVGFCVGAALEFLVGAKKRAPLWMQRLSLEWLYRMAADPKRLWRRYVYGAIPLLSLFAREMLRRPAMRSA
ncbi:WecB/TagA/CpsF family glycosyltransferase [Corticibacterium sp. UT-5YL-CI-8]|nr:WecB/TagA/CpsF family glycosyltransferase [Tianweitania sp. UT-5YL-CI-8]